jgi:hypothetical protein
MDELLRITRFCRFQCTFWNILYITFSPSFFSYHLLFLTYSHQSCVFVSAWKNNERNKVILVIRVKYKQWPSGLDSFSLKNKSLLNPTHYLQATRPFLYEMHKTRDVAGTETSSIWVDNSCSQCNWPQTLFIWRWNVNLSTHSEYVILLMSVCLLFCYQQQTSCQSNLQVFIRLPTNSKLILSLPAD